MVKNEFTLDDFSGGLTDNYVNTVINRFKKLENMLINRSKKPYQRPGSNIYSQLYPKPLPQRINKIIDYEGDYLVSSGGQIFELTGTGWDEIQTVGTNRMFFNATAAARISSSFWNGHIFAAMDDSDTPALFEKPIKIYNDDNGDYQLRTAGLPHITYDLTTGSPGNYSYKYSLHYYYEYNVGDKLFKDFGPTYQQSIDSIFVFDTHTVTINNIPVLSDDSLNKYDANNVKIRIYRTLANGDTLYYVDEIANGTTTYNSTLTDNQIKDNEIIYTDGGRLDNDPPPRCKFMHVTDNTGFYGYIIDGSDTLKTVGRQSIVGDPDSVPESANIEFDEEITGISSFLDRVIFFCRNFVYRVDGRYDAFGGGVVTKQEIHDTAGCVCINSIVKTPNGVAWAGNDGFYVTDGFKVIRLSGEFNKTYKTLVQTDNQKNRIYGSYDPLYDRVHWSIQSGDGVGDEVDTQYVWDTRFGARVDSLFTTLVGSDGSFSPTAHMFDTNGDMIFGDRRGYILKTSESATSDPLIDDSQSDVSLWDRSPIRYHYISTAFTFGSEKVRKFIPKFVLGAKNDNKFSVEVYSNNDLSDQVLPTKPIRNLAGASTGVVQQQRHFDGNSMRCNYRQIEFKTAFVNIADYTTLGTATVNAGLTTVTIDNGDWPSQLVNFYIYFQHDGYVQGHRISSMSLSTLNVINGGNLQAGSQNFIIRGYPKDEKLSLFLITLMYALLGQTQEDYDSASQGDPS